VPAGVLLVTGKVAVDVPEPAIVAGEKLADIPMPGGTVALSVVVPPIPPCGVTDTANPF